ncbi:MAG: pilus assembly protein PilM, partial [Thermovirga sp.]|nr:pilus assembly protein PilM [Thermovirga sp.]
SVSTAGLSLGTGSIRYIELEGSPGDLAVSVSSERRIEGVAIEQEMIADAHSLEAHLLGMKESLGGRWADPVVIGMPSRDVLLRIVEMPAMDTADAREALKWDFDKYFPFPYSDATYDLGPISTTGEGARDSARYVVAASRLHVVNSLLDTARRAGIRVAAVEPANVALYRCARGSGLRAAEGSMVVSVGKNSSQIVVGFGGDGVLYRTLLVGGEPPPGPGAPFAAVAREVSSTFTYLGSQFREMKVDEIILAGDFAARQELKEAIEAVTAVPVTVSDPWKEWGIVGAPEERAGWEAALGLALRSLP